jgi:hypothetical protein
MSLVWAAEYFQTKTSPGTFGASPPKGGFLWEELWNSVLPTWEFGCRTP